MADLLKGATDAVLEATGHALTEEEARWYAEIASKGLIESLLGELPDGPMIDATAAVLEEDADDGGNAPAHIVAETAIERFLRSLRDTLRAG